MMTIATGNAEFWKMTGKTTVFIPENLGAQTSEGKGEKEHENPLLLSHFSCLNSPLLLKPNLFYKPLKLCKWQCKFLPPISSHGLG